MKRRMCDGFYREGMEGVPARQPCPRDAVCRSYRELSERPVILKKTITATNEMQMAVITGIPDEFPLALTTQSFCYSDAPASMGPASHRSGTPVPLAFWCKANKKRPTGSRLRSLSLALPTRTKVQLTKISREQSLLRYTKCYSKLPPRNVKEGPCKILQSPQATTF